MRERIYPLPSLFEHQTAGQVVKYLPQFKDQFMNEITYYKILGIEPDATTEEINKAYKEKAKEYHPDKNGGTKAATDMFQYLNLAKDCLSDPDKRLEYDYSIGVKKRPDTSNPDPQKGSKKSFPYEMAVVFVLAGVLIGLFINSGSGRNS